METRTYKSWWFLTTNGIISVIFGFLMVLCTPDFIRQFILYFGILLLVTGIALLVASINNMKKDKKSVMLVFQSIASITIGLIVIITPKADVLRFFLLLIGVWAIIVGIFQIALLVNVGKNISNKNIILFNGLLTIALGICLCFKPFEFADLVARTLGVFAILFGMVMIYLSFLLRKVSVIRGKENEPHVL